MCVSLCENGPTTHLIYLYHSLQFPDTLNSLWSSFKSTPIQHDILFGNYDPNEHKIDDKATYALGQACPWFLSQIQSANPAQLQSLRQIYSPSLKFLVCPFWATLVQHGGLNGRGLAPSVEIKISLQRCKQKKQIEFLVITQ